MVFLLHGMQVEKGSLGGKQLITKMISKFLLNEGIMVVSISVPGFGNSEGVRDFSGPFSQQAVLDVIAYFKKLPFVDPTRLGIYGISRGAILASMISVNNSDLILQVLESGNYDQVSRRSMMPDYLDGILENLFKESGGSKAALS